MYQLLLMPSFWVRAWGQASSQQLGSYLFLEGTYHDIWAFHLALRKAACVLVVALISKCMLNLLTNFLWTSLWPEGARCATTTLEEPCPDHGDNFFCYAIFCCLTHGILVSMSVCGNNYTVALVSWVFVTESFSAKKNVLLLRNDLIERLWKSKVIWCQPRIVIFLLEFKFQGVFVIREINR